MLWDKNEMELIKPKLNAYFQPYTIWTLHLPSSIVDKLSTISFGKGKVAEKRMDRMMIKISQMISKHEYHKSKHNRDLKCIPVNRDKWIALAGSKAYYQEMEQIILKSGVIHPVLDHKGEHIYKVGEFSKGYYIDKELMKSEKIEVTLNHPSEISPEPSLQQKWLVESYNYIKIPDEEMMLLESKKMINKETKRKQIIISKDEYNKKIEDNKEDIRRYVSIEDHILLYMPILWDGFSEPTYQFNGRMKDSVCGLPAWIRDNMITIDDEEASLCDFRALHHNLWWSIFHDAMNNDKPITFPQVELDWWNENVNGDGHTKLARAILKEEGILNPSDEQLKLMRDEVKLETLSHYNTTLYMMNWKEPGKEYSRLSKLFDKYAEHLYKFIKDTKHGPYGHCNTSILMTRREGRLIQECIKRLKELNIHCLYVHDCLMVAKSNKSIVSKVMNEVALSMNILSTVDNK